MKLMDSKDEKNILERFAEFLRNFPHIKKIRVEGEKSNWVIERPNKDSGKEEEYEEVDKE